MHLSQNHPRTEHEGPQKWRNSCGFHYTPLTVTYFLVFSISVSIMHNIESSSTQSTVVRKWNVGLERGLGKQGASAEFAVCPHAGGQQDSLSCRDSLLSAPRTRLHHFSFTPCPERLFVLHQINYLPLKKWRWPVGESELEYRHARDQAAYQAAFRLSHVLPTLLLKRFHRQPYLGQEKKTLPKTRSFSWNQFCLLFSLLSLPFSISESLQFTTSGD